MLTRSPYEVNRVLSLGTHPEGPARVKQFPGHTFPFEDAGPDGSAARREIPMTSAHVDAVVVGAGPAGLATSQQLSARGIEHVVLERDVIGSTWRSER